MISRCFAIPAEHPALAGHFPGNPIVPGTLLLEYVLCELQRLALPRWPVTLREVKFRLPVGPNEPLHVEIAGLESTRAHARVLRGERTVLEATLGWQ